MADLFLENSKIDAAYHHDSAKIIDDIIKHALLQMASDIHIERNEIGAEVRYRIDGTLHDALRFDAQTGAEIAFGIKQLGHIQTDGDGGMQEGRILFEDSVTTMRIQVSIFPYISGEKIVMRILHPFAKGMTLEKLGMRDAMLEKVHAQIRRSRGVVLITGPVGSGTTTTAYTLIDILSGPSKSIGTVEDPVEHRMPRIHQMQVEPKIGMDFPNCLNALVKQDNDILMVGEIRDSQTLQGVIRASSRGSLIIGTLRAKSVLDGLDIIMGMDNEPFEIAANIHCIISQRLLKRLCTNCRSAYVIDEKVAKKFPLTLDIEKLKGKTVYRAGKGCGKCGSTGYRGNIALFAVLEMNDAIARLIFHQASLDDINAKAKENGMCTLGEDAVAKVLSGLVSLEDAQTILTDYGTF